MRAASGHAAHQFIGIATMQTGWLQSCRPFINRHPFDGAWPQLHRSHLVGVFILGHGATIQAQGMSPVTACVGCVISPLALIYAVVSEDWERVAFIDQCSGSGAVLPAAAQAIADANGGIRTSGTLGYDSAVAYVPEVMMAAGHDVTVQTRLYSTLIPSMPDRASRTTAQAAPPCSRPPCRSGSPRTRPCRSVPSPTRPPKRRRPPRQTRGSRHPYWPPPVRHRRARTPHPTS